MMDLTELLGATVAGLQMRQWLLIGGVALSVMSLFWALTLAIGGLSDPYRRQLNRLQQKPEQQEKRDSLEQRLVLAHSNGIRIFGGHRIRTLLVHAGFQKNAAYRVFNLIRLLFLLLCLVVALAVMLVATSFPFNVVVLLLVVVAYVAYVLPVFVLERLAKKRMKRMKLGMPDGLDLLVVCTEAGMGFKAALQRVAKELSLNHTELAEELELISAKLRAGMSMQQSFEEFILRTGLEDFRSLNVAINQSIQLGTSIAETLRTYADEYRIKRKQEAEEMAAKIGTKMIFPLVLCIWPSFFIVAIGPALIKVFKTFGNM